MPSLLVAGPVSGGPTLLVSGNLWSGQGAVHPVGSVEFYLDASASGFVYVGLSGNMTIRSGGVFLSGSLGYSDGFPIPPGGRLNVPRLGFTSGSFSVYATADAAASGQARLWWQPL